MQLDIALFEKYILYAFAYNKKGNSVCLRLNERKALLL